MVLLLDSLLMSVRVHHLRLKLVHLLIPNHSLEVLDNLLVNCFLTEVGA